MSDRKLIQLSQAKKTTSTEEQPRQSHSSLDKPDKKIYPNKLKMSFQPKKSYPYNPKMGEEKEEESKNRVAPEQWPSSNKRRYLKNYQLPKINSPSKFKKEQITKYDGETNQDILDDEQKMGKVQQNVVVQKNSATLEATSPGKKTKLAPLKVAANYPHLVRTKAGTNGKQSKINQDIAIVQQKLPHGIKLYCICDGHGLNGHLVTAFIKANFVKNLNALLKKLHNPPQKEKFIEICYNVIQTTNQQLLDSDINTELAGSTFVAVFVYLGRLITFNVGDSRAILLQQIKNDICKEQTPEKEEKKFPQLSHQKAREQYQWKVFPLSVDQKPDRPDEKQRIIKNGGRAFAQTNESGEEIGPTRVWMKDIMMPGLAMSRSFGDKAGIKAGTNAEPQLIEHGIQDIDKLVIVASDGVWQYLQNEQVMKAVLPGLMKGDLTMAADILLKRAVQTWTKMNFSRDDITFIIVKLNQPDK